MFHVKPKTRFSIQSREKEASKNPKTRIKNEWARNLSELSSFLCVLCGLAVAVAAAVFIVDCVILPDER